MFVDYNPLVPAVLPSRDHRAEEGFAFYEYFDVILVRSIGNSCW